MSFCRLSTELIANHTTEIDNIFFDNFLPTAPDDCVKVYLYGLFLSANNLEIDNNIEAFAKKLNMTELDVETAFRYWEEQGLVQVLSTYPIQVLFKPLKDIINGTRLYKPEKYEKFNTQAQELLKGKREISKTEYGEYYDFLENTHMEQEALLMIMDYCIESKKKAVGYNYILTVAKNWAKEGLLTVSQIEEKLCKIEQTGTNLSEILKILGLKRTAYIEEREKYEIWKEGMGFDDETILYVAKNMQKKGGFERLNNLLEKYFMNGKTSINEIKHYVETQDEVYNLTKKINRNMGIYYESLENEIETYINPWLNLGFEYETLEKLSSYAFKSSIRTLESLDKLVQKLYKLGILTNISLDEYLMRTVSVDNEIKSILEKLGITRRVNSYDRENYKTWKNDWAMSDELINYAISLSIDKLSPIPYLSRILASWHDKKITSIEQAKKDTINQQNSPTIKGEIKGRSYTKEDYQAMIQSIDEVEL